MLDPIRKLLTEAGKAKQVRAFWDAAAAILSEWTGGARVELGYKGLRETGSAQAGIAGKPGDPFIADYHDAEGRHVSRSEERRVGKECRCRRTRDHDKKKRNKYRR